MYIFYDTETSGLNTDFAQIFQIALTFVDDDFNILSSKKLECRRAPWVIPSPSAMLITGFTPDDLKNAKASHYDMMSQVVQWVQGQHWPITFVGYNSLGYDEPVLANNLAVNLLRHDLTTAVNPDDNAPNTRFDIFALVKAVAHYYPGALTLDIKTDKGKPSMKLGDVARQNGIDLSAENAHDALNDVRATIGVAKLLRDIAPDLWQHMIEHMSSTQAAVRFMTSQPVFACTTMMYGRNETYAATRCAAAADGNRQLVFDLAHDPVDYAGKSVEELEQLIRQSFEWGGKPNKTPFRLVRVDHQPMITSVEAAKNVLHRYDATRAQARAQLLLNDQSLQDKLAQALSRLDTPKASFNAASDRQMQGAGAVLEKMLDAPVPELSRAKLAQWLADFHAQPDWSDRVGMVRRFAAGFAEDIALDPTIRRFGKLAGRVILDNDPQSLTPSEYRQMMSVIARRVLTTDESVEWLTIPKARAELETIERERAEGKKWQQVSDSEIRALKLFYTSIEKDLVQWLTPAQETKPQARKPEQPKP